MSLDDRHMGQLTVVMSWRDTLLRDAPPQEGSISGGNQAPQESPNHPHLTCRAVYRLLVRRSKACWRALVRSVRSAHVGKASKGGEHKLLVARARAPLPRAPTSDPKLTQPVLAGLASASRGAHSSSKCA